MTVPGSESVTPTNLSFDILKRKIDGKRPDELISRFLREMRLKHINYFCVHAGGGMLPVSLGTFPAEWRETYELRGYVAIDPVVAHMVSSRAPCFWDKLANLTAEQERFMREAALHVGERGVTIPLGTEKVFAGISIMSDEGLEDWRGRLSEIIWNGSVLGQQIHATVLSEHGANDESEALQQKHIDLLTLLANGMEPSEIAMSIGSTEAEVRRQLENAQKRLRANSHSQAMAKAATLGLLRL